MQGASMIEAGEALLRMSNSAHQIESRYLSASRPRDGESEIGEIFEAVVFGAFPSHPLIPQVQLLPTGQSTHPDGTSAQSQRTHGALMESKRETLRERTEDGT